MKVIMGDDDLLSVTFDPSSDDYRVVIINKGKHNDIRISDGQTIVKIRCDGKSIKDILVDDIFVYAPAQGQTRIIPHGTEARISEKVR